MKRKRIWIAAFVVALIGVAVGITAWMRRPVIPAVTVERVQRRDLEALVSASGKIQPKRSVNISADTMGRVTQLAVNEGDRVERGQFLLQIDPTSLERAVERGEASLEAARSSIEQIRAEVAAAGESLALARTNLTRQRELWSQGLTTREALDRAENEVKIREQDLKLREQQITTQEQRIRQERAALEGTRYDLSKVRIVSPIRGIVTRRTIEEGETVVIGTMNNAGTVLMTIADMSVIEAEVEVDETDIPSVVVGQTARVTIDAIPDRTFAGTVREIGNSPIQPTTAQQQATTARQATNFKVKVTLEGDMPDHVRPGYTCTADITTATRTAVLAVPIQATTVREMVLDRQGAMVRRPRRDRPRPTGVEPSVTAAELEPGQSRKELEGVFVFRDDHAEFVPVQTGITGEKYFELLSGLGEGAQVVIGPFSSVRELEDGDPIKLEDTDRRPWWRRMLGTAD
jgi:HlyD family secretion protein